MSDAFDADVLIFAVNGGEHSEAVRRALHGSEERIGSVLLLPEVLSKPIRLGNELEVQTMIRVLASLELKPVEIEIAQAAAEFGAAYNLKAADAIHLATAVVWGAERFHTNNRKDFGPHIAEIDVIWPSA